MAHVDVAVVGVLLQKPLTGPQTLAAQLMLDVIETRILREYPTILASDPARLKLLDYAEANAVVRVLRNPESMRQLQKSIDDYSISYTVDSMASSGQLQLTDEEWADLSPVVTPSQASGAWTITPSYVPG